MNYNILDRGLIKEEQLKKLSYLSFSKESKQITALLTLSVRKLRTYLKISFILETISTLIILIIISLIPILLLQSSFLILVLAMLYVSFHAFVIFFRLVKLHYLNRYVSLVKDLGDNLLSVIFDYYKLSLGEKLPDFSEVKDLTNDLVSSTLSLREYQRFIREMIGIVSGLLILMVLGVSSKFILFIHVAILIAVILVLFAVNSILEAMYSAHLFEYKRENIEYDRSFKNSQPLLSVTTLDFNKSDYLAKLKPLLVLFDNINIVSIINRSLLPILLLFLPLLLGDMSGGIYLLVVGLFISNRLFLIKNPVLNRANTIKGEHRLRQLSYYLDTILEKGSELTPSVYNRLKKDLVEQNPRIKIGNGLIWGDLNIENLNYYTGWSKNKRQIHVDNISLPYGKVSFLTGDYGIGKTLFGRTITLSYSNFSADKLAIGEKDLRSFNTLESAIKYLHLSSFRKADTTYRKALSVYIKDHSGGNLLIKKMIEFDIENEVLIEHFRENEEYYGTFFSLLKDILDGPNSMIQKNKLEGGYFKLASELFRNFEYSRPTFQILKQLKDDIEENVFNSAVILAARAEYLSFEHMKNYIPEASLHHMDTILTNPPISKEMRLRFLLSMDVLMRGLLLVVDEPFGQDINKEAHAILADLIEYAKNYNAVVLIIDEKLHYELIDRYKEQNVFGKILRFEDEGFSLVIKANDLE